MYALAAAVDLVAALGIEGELFARERGGGVVAPYWKSVVLRGKALGDAA